MRGADDLRVFVSVVEQSGFASAGRTLGVTRSAICRRIDRLEKRLGVRLLDRTTRAIQMTDAGAMLYERGMHILAEIEQAELVASKYGGEPQGIVRVTSPIMIGLHRLVPMLGEFLGHYVQIKIQLDLVDDAIDPGLTDHDVAIRWGEQAPSSLIITRLGESRQIICAAPSYLRRHGTPRTPHELLAHNCIMMTRLGFSHNDWTFRISGRPVTIRVAGNFVVNGGDGNYEALISGLGIGRATNFRVHEDIRSGRLQPILQEFEPPEAMPIYVAYKAERFVPPKIRAFVDFLRKRMRSPGESPEIGRRK